MLRGLKHVSRGLKQVARDLLWATRDDVVTWFELFLLEISQAICPTSSSVLTQSKRKDKRALILWKSVGFSEFYQSWILGSKLTPTWNLFDIRFEQHSIYYLWIIMETCTSFHSREIINTLTRLRSNLCYYIQALIWYGDTAAITRSLHYSIFNEMLYEGCMLRRHLGRDLGFL